MREQSRVIGFEPEAVTRREEQRRRGASAEQGAQRRLAGVVFHGVGDRPAGWQIVPKLVGERYYQLVHAELRGLVVWILRAEEHSSLGKSERSLLRLLFRIHDAPGIPGILIQGVRLVPGIEVDATHRELHIEQILKAERDVARVAHDQEVVRELGGIDGARPEVEPLEKLGLALPRAVGTGAIELIVVTARLGFAPFEQRSERLFQVRDSILVLVREEHAPSHAGE